MNNFIGISHYNKKKEYRKKYLFLLFLGKNLKIKRRTKKTNDAVKGALTFSSIVATAIDKKIMCIYHSLDFHSSHKL